MDELKKFKSINFGIIEDYQLAIQKNKEDDPPTPLPWKNTWKDWHIITEGRASIVPPQLETNFVEIPGVSGSVDLSTSLTDYPVFKDRTGTIDFIVLNDYVDDSGRFVQNKPFMVLYDEINEYLNGKRMQMQFAEFPDYYYEGRFMVKSYTSNNPYKKIQVEYQLYPYRKSIYNSYEYIHHDGGYDHDWLWDSFNFENGIIFNSLNMNDTTLESYQITKSIITNSVPETYGLFKNGVQYAHYLINAELNNAAKIFGIQPQQLILNVEVKDYHEYNEHPMTIYFNKTMPDGSSRVYFSKHIKEGINEFSEIILYGDNYDKVSIVVDGEISDTLKDMCEITVIFRPGRL